MAAINLDWQLEGDFHCSVQHIFYWQEKFGRTRHDGRIRYEFDLHACMVIATALREDLDTQQLLQSLLATKQTGVIFDFFGRAKVLFIWMGSAT